MYHFSGDIDCGGINPYIKRSVFKSQKPLPLLFPFIWAKQRFWRSAKPLNFPKMQGGKGGLKGSVNKVHGKGNGLPGLLQISFIFPIMESTGDIMNFNDTWQWRLSSDLRLVFGSSADYNIIGFWEIYGLYA